jgi:hypothetical protein
MAATAAAGDPFDMPASRGCCAPARSGRDRDAIVTIRTPPPTRLTPDLRRATAEVTHVFEPSAALVALVGLVR